MMSTPFRNLFFGQIRRHNKRVLRTLHKVSGPQTLGLVSVSVWEAVGSSQHKKGDKKGGHGLFLAWIIRICWALRLSALA